jgi:hypothetical protein
MVYILTRQQGDAPPKYLFGTCMGLSLPTFSLLSQIQLGIIQINKHRLSGGGGTPSPVSNVRKDPFSVYPHIPSLYYDDYNKYLLLVFTSL